MNIIGIDYSLKSPGVAVFHANNKVSYFAFPREGSVKEDFIITLEKAGVICTIVDNPKSGKTLQERERFNSIDANRLAVSLCSVIKTYVDEDTLIGIEGISFASPGNTKVQYSGYHYVLREVLHSYFDLDYNNMYVFAPMSVKMTAGKGNFKKDDMIDAFLKSDFKLENTLRDKMLSEPLSFQSPKAKRWVKPIDDLVDSFWTARTVANFIEKETKQS